VVPVASRGAEKTQRRSERVAKRVKRDLGRYIVGVCVVSVCVKSCGESEDGESVVPQTTDERTIALCDLNPLSRIEDMSYISQQLALPRVLPNRSVGCRFPKGDSISTIQDAESSSVALKIIPGVLLL
jgi:hypothetical protein